MKQVCCSYVTLVSSWFLLSLVSVRGEFLSSTAIIQRSLENDGFHRTLSTRVSIPEREDKLTESLSLGCTLLIVDQFPAGMYVDPDELRRLAVDSTIEESRATWRNLSEVGLQLETFRTDIEAPHQQSKPFRFVSLFAQTSTGVWESSLPIHFRYHRAVAGVNWSAEVKLQKPELCVLCETDSEVDAISNLQPTCSVQNDEKSVYRIGYDDRKSTTDVTALVPVGALDQQDIVQYMTAVITMGASLALSCYALWRPGPTAGSL